MKPSIGDHHFFTTSCRRQNYENYQQPLDLQRLQSSDFQIYFSVLEISGIFPICFSWNYLNNELLD